MIRHDITAIKVNNVCMTFNIPVVHHTTLLEYITHPFRSQYYKKFDALNKINIEIKKGEFLGIIGRNGSGKSTLLKIIAGIYKPTTGHVHVNGHLVPFLELGVGFHPDLSARENVYLNGIILGMRRNFLRKNFDRIIHFAGLKDFIEMPLKNYSSGMRVRLAFSIAMMSNADIFLLDEILAVGDFNFQEKCTAVFKKYKEEGKTIILVTHSAENLKKYCSRVLLIESGSIKAQGEPEKVLAIYHNG